MNVGNVAQNMNPYLGAYKSTSKVQGGNFQNTMSEVETPSKSLQLHGLYGSTAEDGSQVVGAWADAVAGTSTTVYQPADFNPEEPVYTMKIWDSEDNLIEERTVNLNDVDVNHCDNFDMYAYSCYLSKSGKYPDAMNKFLMIFNALSSANLPSAPGAVAASRNTFFMLRSVSRRTLSRAFIAFWISSLICSNKAIIIKN